MSVDKLIPGRLVPAGEWIQTKAVVSITYSSVYGDQWHLRSDSFVPASGPAPSIR